MYTGNAEAQLATFLHRDKGKGLGISLLKDESTRYWDIDPQSLTSNQSLMSFSSSNPLKSLWRVLLSQKWKQERSSKELSNKNTHQSGLQHIGSGWHLLCLGRSSLSTVYAPWSTCCMIDWTIAVYITSNTVGYTAGINCFPSVCGIPAPKLSSRIYRFLCWLSCKSNTSFLGPSPNSGVYDPSSVRQPCGFLEIKCSYSHQDEKSEAACKSL